VCSSDLMSLRDAVTDDGTLLFDFMRTSIESFGVSGARLVIAALAAASALMLALTHTYFARASLVSGLVIAVVVLCLPASATQYVFINGSHPTWAMPFIAFGVVSACAAVTANRAAAKALWCAAGFFSFLMAQQMSPTAPLASLGVVGLLLMSPRSVTRLATTLFIGVGPVLFYIASYVLKPASRNHYTHTDGWLSFAPLDLITRLFELVQYFFTSTFSWSFGLVLFFIALSTVASIAFFALRTRPNLRFNASTVGDGPFDASIAFSAVCILTAGFALAPALAVTHNASRYLEVPALFLGFGIFSLAFRLAPRRPEFLSSWMVVILLAFGVSNVIHTQRVLSDALREQLTMSRLLDQFVEAERGEWDFNAQVVIYGDERVATGLNHWSTWYLRYLAHRGDVIALLGGTRQMTRDPLVSRYKNHGEDYWAQGASGRTVRMPMIGLEDDRPTYVYELRDGVFEERQHILIDRPSGLVTLAQAGGGTIGDGATGSPDEICDTPHAAEAVRNAAIWRQPYTVTPREISGSPVEFSGSNHIQLTLTPVDGVLDWSAGFDPAMPDLERADFGQTHPPMPVLWGNFFIRQRDATTLEIGIGGQLIAADANPGELTPVGLHVRDGCYAEFSIGDQALRYWGWDIPDRQLLLGRGWYDRYWTGTVVLAE